MSKEKVRQIFEAVNLQPDVFDVHNADYTQSAIAMFLGWTNKQAEKASRTPVPKLYKTIFHHLKNEKLRVGLVNHLHAEARRCKMEQEDAPSIAQPQSPKSMGKIKVLSDVDDTIVSFKDKRFPIAAVVPGAQTFYEQLALSQLDKRIYAPQERQEDKVEIALLTARPRGFWDSIEMLSLRHLNNKGVFTRQGSHGEIKAEVTVLSGRAASLLSHQKMADQKLRNFMQFRALYPTHGFIFNGDSGQGDVALGSELLRLFPNDVKAVLIHEINKRHSCLEESAKKQYENEGIAFYRTYVGAAVEAFNKGALGLEGMHTVACATLRGMEEINFSTVSKSQRDGLAEDLKNDVQRLNAVLIREKWEGPLL